MLITDQVAPVDANAGVQQLVDLSTTYSGNQYSNDLPQGSPAPPGDKIFGIDSRIVFLIIALIVFYTMSRKK